MRRIAILIASAAINASTIPTLAAECASNKDIDASRTRWETLRSQPATAGQHACAASFYESVTLRQAAASRVDGARVLTALDSVINGFNDLVAAKCGG